MAKKVVATLKSDDKKGHAKVIKMVKSPKTGAYTFQEEMILNDDVKEYFSKKLLISSDKIILLQFARIEGVFFFATFATAASVLSTPARNNYFELNFLR